VCARARSAAAGVVSAFARVGCDYLYATASVGGHDSRGSDGTSLRGPSEPMRAFVSSVSRSGQQAIVVRRCAGWQMRWRRSIARPLHNWVFRLLLTMCKPPILLEDFGYDRSGETLLQRILMPRPRTTKTGFHSGVCMLFQAGAWKASHFPEDRVQWAKFAHFLPWAVRGAHAFAMYSAVAGGWALRMTTYNPIAREGSTVHTHRTQTVRQHSQG
jgi:hypothetical protein